MQQLWTLEGRTAKNSGMLRLRRDSDQIISTNTTCTEKFRGKAPEKCCSSSRCKVYTLHSGILMVANECPADQENNLFKFLWTIVTECSISRNDCPLEVTSLTKGQYFFQLHISQPGCIWGFCSFWKKSGRGGPFQVFSHPIYRQSDLSG